jgi:sugar lactone lactonase YvrE
MGDPFPVQINVQPALTQTVFASITDPVALKWSGTNLYVLSGSGAAITKFNTNGSTVCTLSGLGVNPTGFDVDSAGNIFVAITSSNQIWKFIPTNSSYIADASFGLGGFIGDAGGSAGANTNQFNAPFDVAVSPDGGTISISDSGNNRIQQFDTSGNYLDSFGTNGTDAGQFNMPKGLAYDSVGMLYIIDSENSRITLAQDAFVEEVTGTNGTALGQFSGPINISSDERGVYVADTGNNRIQCFSPPVPHSLFNIGSSSIRFAVSTNLNQPAAVAAVDSLTNETFYVADTGNNRIVLYSIATDNPTPVWTSMTSHVVSGDMNGALSYFSIASVDQYRQAFFSVGKANAISAMNQVGALIPVYVNADRAEYYFTNTVDGQTIGFPVEFDKENGVWKILEY